MSRRDDDGENDSVPLSAADIERFEQLAPAALARRDRGFLSAEAARGVEQIVSGCVPIIGLLHFGWSAGEMLFFLFIRSWTAILCDVARLVFAEKGVRKFADVKYDDWFVWVVAGALRNGTRRAPRSHLAARYEPWLGVLVDFLCGGISTAVIALAFMRAPDGSFGEVSLGRGAAWSAAGIVAYQVLAAAWEIIAWRRRPTGELRATPGMRGLGLFLLMFVVAMASESGGEMSKAPQPVMLVVNGALVALGLFNLAGLGWVSAETRWLRGYLEEGRGGAGRR